MILYRAVSRLELLDLARMRTFRGGGRLGLEAKLFTPDGEDALFFSSTLTNPYIVEVDVPDELAAKLGSQRLDGRAVVAIDRELLAEFNASVTIRLPEV
ncbi:MAG TPA: hypothetical protein VMW62_07860 [Chloroflexota bacterium]|nr:hypothetical protein [Chloroflexota bacterium]